MSLVDDFIGAERVLAVSSRCHIRFETNSFVVEARGEDRRAVVPSGDVLALVLNPVADNWGKRTPLSIFLSADQGVSFTKALDLETEDGEFSYPAIIADGNRLYVTYTWNRQKIAFCELEL